METAIYWHQGSTQSPMTTGKQTRKGKNCKGKLPQSWKGRQGLKPPKNQMRDERRGRR